MLYSRNLITRFVPSFENVSDEQFTKAINALGMELESIYKYPEVNNVVIGQLVSYRPVEGTHLNICEVKISPTTTNTIVCGASGLKAGAKVIVALEGARLPNGVTISKRMIRSVESNGMICAYSELTNNDSFVSDSEHDEIIMLEHGDIGSSDWRQFIGLDDTIYDITIPANRNDEKSYLVFCYEIANKLNLKFNFDFNAIKVGSNSAIKPNVDKTVCNFLAFLDYPIKANDTARSGWQIKSVLMNHGIKPINSILDRLAYITLLTNCPTYVYDCQKLNGNLSCRQSGDEKKFIALNGKTFTLSPKDILIYDSVQPVSIAAVIGSDNTKLTSNTTNVKIEIGNFDYAQVRTTSIRLNCETDASKKASRPLSTYLNLLALYLIKNEFGKPDRQTIYCNKNWNKSKIDIDYEKLAWFIGEKLSNKFVISSLKKMGYTNSLFSRNKFAVPKWRLDVSNSADLYEDILKIIDVNKLNPVAIADNLLPVANNTEYDLKQQIKDLFINNYFTEVKTYNLTNKSNLDKFNIFDKKNPIRILSNNSNREFFRLSLIDNMLKVYQYNDARKSSLRPIFEIQKLFTNDQKNLNITALTLDKYSVDAITHSELLTNLNYFKSILKQLSTILNTQFSFKQAKLNCFYENETIAIESNNEIIGFVGKIRSSVLKDYDLNNKQIYALTINIEKLLSMYQSPIIKVKEFGVFQTISRDINIILNESNAHLVSKKLEQIKQITNIADAKVVNIFKKDNKLIYTVRYYLTDKRNFTAKDIESITKQIENLSGL